MELNTHYEDSDTAKEIYTELASGDNRTEQGRIYDTLRHGTGELADKTTPSAKKCTALLLWCTLVNSILIGLLIIAVSVSLYMSINVPQASNSKADMQNLVTTLSQKIDKIEHAQGQIQTEVLQNTNRLNETADLQKLVTTQSQNIDKLEHAQGQIQTETLQNTNRLNEANVSVGFAVSYPDTSSGSPLKFKQVIYNSGDDYNVSSGVFTCRYPGLYFFAVTLIRNPGVYYSVCGFFVNDSYVLVVNSGSGNNDGLQSGSTSLVYRLKAGDILNLSRCTGQDHMDKMSSFTGFRVSY